MAKSPAGLEAVDRIDQLTQSAKVPVAMAKYQPWQRIKLGLVIFFGTRDHFA